MNDIYRKVDEKPMNEQTIERSKGCGSYTCLAFVVL
jgi:hypothetical protein